MRGVRGQGMLATVAAVAAALMLPVGAQGSAGDVYVSDIDAGPSSDGAIFKLGRTGGSPSVLAESTMFEEPLGMTLDPRGRLIVADDEEGLFVVDRSTGAVSTLFGPSSVDQPFDVAFGADGRLYIHTDGPDGPRILRANLKTGQIETLATGSGEWTSATGIAVTRKGAVYFTQAGDEVFRLDPKTGLVSTLEESGLLQGADGLLLSPDERTLYVAAFSSNPENNLVKIDLKTGEATKLAGFDDIVAVSLLPSGDFLASDTDDFDDGFEGIHRVGRAGSPTTVFSGDPDFVYPHDIVVEPKKCKGKFPTVVGTDQNEKIKGSKFADVISTLGGKDKVNGGKGNDIVCGGKGKDKLKGGKGKDKLRGQKGKDTCIGNGGKDKAVGCEAGKV